MKRISVSTMAVLMLLSGITSAHSYHSAFRWRIRYSPYAFSHKNPSGLVCGVLRYSPYAFSEKNPTGLAPYYLRYSPYAFSCSNPSGLVPDYYRYSPYAFSHKNPSGLISDYCWSYYWPYYYYPNAYSRTISDLVDRTANSRCCVYRHDDSNRLCETKVSYEEKAIIRRERAKWAAEYANKMKMIREKDGKEIIYNYLKNNAIEDFEVDRLLKIGSKTISINFVFKDKNIIIKYWNPEEIKALMQQSGYKKIYYEQYEQQWKDFCKKHEENGGKVYQIESADKQEILSKLSLYMGLIEG
jgi:hypothetical protein